MADVSAPQPNVALAPFTTLRVGGPAEWFVRAETPEQVRQAFMWAAERNLPLFPLGGGSNVVIADRGLRGLVMQLALRGLSWSADGTSTLLHAAAGEPWDPVVEASVNRGFAGLECLSGIPGSVGGTPIQNVGAYGQDVAQTIEAVFAFDRQGLQQVTLPAGECGFTYRMSRFKAADAARFIVTGVVFRLSRGAPNVTYPDVEAWMARERITTPSVQDVRRAVLEVRRRKGMVLDADDPDTRSVGSFFMNPVVAADVFARLTAGPDAPRGFELPDGRVKVPAAWLIEHAGFSKGQSMGGARISTKHPLALTNAGGACAADIVRLAAAVKRGVGERTGVWLRPEPVFAGFDGDPDVQFLLEANS